MDTPTSRAGSLVSGISRRSGSPRTVDWNAGGTQAVLNQKGKRSRPLFLSGDESPILFDGVLGGFSEQPDTPPESPHVLEPPPSMQPRRSVSMRPPPIYTDSTSSSIGQRATSLIESIERVQGKGRSVTRSPSFPLLEAVVVLRESCVTLRKPVGKDTERRVSCILYSKACKDILARYYNTWLSVVLIARNMADNSQLPLYNDSMELVSEILCKKSSTVLLHRYYVSWHSVLRSCHEKTEFSTRLSNLVCHDKRLLALRPSWGKWTRFALDKKLQKCYETRCLSKISRVLSHATTTSSLRRYWTAWTGFVIHMSRDRITIQTTKISRLLFNAVSTSTLRECWAYWTAFTRKSFTRKADRARIANTQLSKVSVAFSKAVSTAVLRRCWVNWVGFAEGKCKNSKATHHLAKVSRLLSTTTSTLALRRCWTDWTRYARRTRTKRNVHQWDKISRVLSGATERVLMRRSWSRLAANRTLNQREYTACKKITREFVRILHTNTATDLLRTHYNLWKSWAIVVARKGTDGSHKVFAALNTVRSLLMLRRYYTKLLKRVEIKAYTSPVVVYPPLESANSKLARRTSVVKQLYYKWALKASRRGGARKAMAKMEVTCERTTMLRYYAKMRAFTRKTVRNKRICHTLLRSTLVRRLAETFSTLLGYRTAHKLAVALHFNGLEARASASYQLESLSEVKTLQRFYSRWVFLIRSRVIRRKTAHHASVASANPVLSRYFGSLQRNSLRRSNSTRTARFLSLSSRRVFLHRFFTVMKSFSSRRYRLARASTSLRGASHRAVLLRYFYTLKFFAFSRSAVCRIASHLSRVTVYRIRKGFYDVWRRWAMRKRFFEKCCGVLERKSWEAIRRDRLETWKTWVRIRKKSQIATATILQRAHREVLQHGMDGLKTLLVRRNLAHAKRKTAGELQRRVLCGMMASRFQALRVYHEKSRQNHFEHKAAGALASQAQKKLVSSRFTTLLSHVLTQNTLVSRRTALLAREVSLSHLTARSRASLISASFRKISLYRVVRRHRGTAARGLAAVTRNTLAKEGYGKWLRWSVSRKTNVKTAENLVKINEKRCLLSIFSKWTTLTAANKRNTTTTARILESSHAALLRERFHSWGQWGATVKKTRRMAMVSRSMHENCLVNLLKWGYTRWVKWVKTIRTRRRTISVALYQSNTCATGVLRRYYRKLAMNRTRNMDLVRRCYTKLKGFSHVSRYGRCRAMLQGLKNKTSTERYFVKLKSILEASRGVLRAVTFRRWRMHHARRIRARMVSGLLMEKIGKIQLKTTFEALAAAVAKRKRRRRRELSSRAVRTRTCEAVLLTTKKTILRYSFALLIKLVMKRRKVTQMARAAFFTLQGRYFSKLRSYHLLAPFRKQVDALKSTLLSTTAYYKDRVRKEREASSKTANNAAAFLASRHSQNLLGIFFAKLTRFTTQSRVRRALTGLTQIRNAHSARV